MRALVLFVCLISLSQASPKDIQPLLETMEELSGPINAIYSFFDGFIDACDTSGEAKNSECRVNFDSISTHAENTFLDVVDCALGGVQSCIQFPDDLMNYKTAIL